MYNLKQYSFRQLNMEFDELREPEYAITMLMIAMNLLPVMVTTWVIQEERTWSSRFFLTCRSSAVRWP